MKFFLKKVWSVKASEIWDINYLKYAKLHMKKTSYKHEGIEWNVSRLPKHIKCKQKKKKNTPLQKKKPLKKHRLTQIDSTKTRAPWRLRWFQLRSRNFNVKFDATKSNNKWQLYTCKIRYACIYESMWSLVLIVLLNEWFTYCWSYFRSCNVIN